MYKPAAAPTELPATSIVAPLVCFRSDIVRLSASGFGERVSIVGLAGKELSLLVRHFAEREDTPKEKRDEMRRP